MSDDIEKEKRKVELDNLGRLVDRYAQSKVLGHGVVMLCMAISIILLVGVIKLWPTYVDTTGEFCVVIGLTVLWILLTTWFAKRCEYHFYRREGHIELQTERIPIWAWGAYVVTFIGPMFLNVFNIMQVRWALSLSLASFGIFILYIGKKHKEKVSAIVFGGLCLTEAIATAAGVPTLFMNKEWLYSYFVALMIYIIGSGLIAVVVIHVYNRIILRKIKQIRPFDEQQTDKSDT